MKYRNLYGIDKPLSILTYGTPGNATKEETRREAFHCYDLAWEAGFRTFDTGYSYGCGEETLGAWLSSRHHRNEAVILDKGCNPGMAGSTDIFCAQTIRDQVEKSLLRLRTDHVELYILHRDDSSIPVDEIVEELNRLHQEGKVIRFGGSNWTLDRIREANAYANAHGLEPFSVVSPAYSLAEYIHDPWGGSVALSGHAQAEYRQWLGETGTPVFCYSSLARGYLSGKFRTDGVKPMEECIWEGTIKEYDAPENRARLARAERLADKKGCAVSTVCLAWLLHQPMELFPIITPSGRAHIQENVAALDLQITDRECEWLLCGD